MHSHAVTELHLKLRDSSLSTQSLWRLVAAGLPGSPDCRFTSDDKHADT